MRNHFYGSARLRRALALFLVFSALIGATAVRTANGTEKDAQAVLSKYGSRGEEVRQIQTKLKDAGYYTGDVNGIFDKATETAVKAFQAASGLKQDGIVGSATWQALTGTYMGGGTLPEKVVVMKRGSKGESVFQLQSFLVDKGYLEATVDGKSSVDGKYGPGTAVAVMKYQKAKGMEKVDGIVGAETYAKLKEDGLLSYPTK
jgi:peptidoglycan hydrolase-like protein with peptidoglycan-binding domain